MSNVILRPDWYLPDSAATDPSLYLNRRQVLRTLGLGTIGLATLGAGCGNANGTSVGADSAAAPRSSPRPDGPLDTIPANAPRDGYPAMRVTEGFPEPGRPITERLTASSYNNFYEFRNQGDLKDLWHLTADYEPFPWTIEVRGEVEQPMTLDVADLITEMDLEERVYRFRCVEAWSMTIPWTGFPLRKLIEKCAPNSNARFVRFVSVNRPEQMPGLANSPWYPWPYFEALRMDEAMNDLALVATGMYGEPLPKQNGSPLRLALPWKYGYKGPKAFVLLEFTREQPPTFWNELQPAEYSFLSNVNPTVPHPRWSQASERFLLSDTEGERVPTLMFNGYAEQVGALYPDEPQG
ncbi:MAG: protein-methionine-sulfoxide reductase catalytic subunit MsrP [Rhodothermaceae bacterium]|nr:protein-methionine-sulfoxide reductase catalytic subunit MsrP [Rhodothermaceae bacterium]